MSTTNTAQSTPGPWRIRDRAHDRDIIEGANGYHVALVSTLVGINATQTDANARLIAEAPAMRAELANLATWLIAPDTSNATLNELRQSIRALLARIDGTEAGR